MNKDFIYDWRPEYEVWVYYEINENPDDHIVYIFGPKYGSLEFGLRNGVEELIHDNAFRDIEGPSHIIPGLKLIENYYSHLYHIDYYFRERLEIYKDPPLRSRK